MEFTANVVRVIDGDTVVLDVDLGFGVWLHKQSFRLLGLNARERSQPGGKEATQHLISLLAATPQEVTLQSVKRDKYGGRYDATLILPDGTNVNGELVAGGWGAVWDGSGIAPVPPWPRRTTSEGDTPTQP